MPSAKMNPKVFVVFHHLKQPKQHSQLTTSDKVDRRSKSDVTQQEKTKI